MNRGHASASRTDSLREWIARHDEEVAVVSIAAGSRLLTGTETAHQKWIRNGISPSVPSEVTVRRGRPAARSSVAAHWVGIPLDAEPAANTRMRSSPGPSKTAGRCAVRQARRTGWPYGCRLHAGWASRHGAGSDRCHVPPSRPRPGEGSPQHGHVRLGATLG